MDPAYYHGSISVKLWPPSQNTRSMLVERMIKNLTTPSKSILSRKYGLLDKKEAEEISKKIEALAYASANLHFGKKPDGDGSSAVQLYAKESSKLMLEAVKRGPLMGKEDGIVITEKSTTRDNVFDISEGRRALINEEEAKELLKPLGKHGNKYTKICFSNHSFGLDAAHVAESFLFSLKDQLKEVDLSDFIAGRPEDEALKVMKIFSSVLDGCELRYLNLSNNALGEKGVRAFESLLKSQHNLEELYLMNDDISEAAARAVRELLPSTEKLKVLQFHNNMTGDEGAIAISELVKHSPVLENFRCSSTMVDSDGGFALAEALGTCTNLKKLDLSDNMFGIKSGVALSKALLGCPNLREVYLSYLNLADEGCIALANALKESAPSLEVLEMSGNEITAKAALALSSLITSSHSLTKLNLSENELKDEGAIQIAKALEQGCVELNEVDLSTNLIRGAGARVLAQAVIAKPGFKLLNINANYISDEGVDEIKDMFKSSPAVLSLLESKLKGLEIKHAD
ncbi:WPP domain-containing protein [Heracleum sosnowskyi]|uniref:WPP domain-containing protein n=1 Tax=Heracleum sosnowskyi TaxID=360622 RepID=A0AAD8MHJ3_9APIA|nr:WPP domain-containing protein [Heracleum sosnowskyi]